MPENQTLELWLGKEPNKRKSEPTLAVVTKPDGDDDIRLSLRFRDDSEEHSIGYFMNRYSARRLAIALLEATQ